MYKAVVLTAVLLGCTSLAAHGTLEAGILPRHDGSAPPAESTILRVPPDVLRLNQATERYVIHGASSGGLPLGIGVLSGAGADEMRRAGYSLVRDFKVELDDEERNGQDAPVLADASGLNKIVNSGIVHDTYGHTGRGVTIAIVDTGVDFSNPDITHALARDHRNHPVMLDADGQGIVITNATFVANIHNDGTLGNYSGELPENTTSRVYRNLDGVFLDIEQGGRNTEISVYNAYYPETGDAPVFDGILSRDMKIGESLRDYIVSRSGVYHLGVMYQPGLAPSQRTQTVPVLVVDSQTPGIYDTIIPDISTSWQDYTRTIDDDWDDFDFDFTDETPIILGSGNEFLRYDHDGDGTYDYSAGTVGAHIVDVYGVMGNASRINDEIGAVNGTVLEPLDPEGNYLGVMTDSVGHGTSSASTIASAGVLEYDIYNGTERYTIRGVAPDARILPIKSLWYGDVAYAWLWAAGFENTAEGWKYEGRRAEIASNSWSVTAFPAVGTAPGYDVLSLLLNALAVPQSLDQEYPGIMMVSSAGNAGHGYGTMGLPPGAAFGTAVGAVTNNVFVGHGSFEGQPRFGTNTTEYGDIADFTSRGPSLVADPKPDIMGVGAFGFVPSPVTKQDKESDAEPFTLYGGTSMAAPTVAGVAALVLEAMRNQSSSPTVFDIKNIIMSTAADLESDPYTQGAGLADAGAAVEAVYGEGGRFLVYGDATYENIRDLLDPITDGINTTEYGLDGIGIPTRTYPLSNWFAGHLEPGTRSIAEFTIENPGDRPLEIVAAPKKLDIIMQSNYNGTTMPRTLDAHTEWDPDDPAYAPNYVPLSEIRPHADIASYYTGFHEIPPDASLLVLNLNFEFDDFMNRTGAEYADEIKIASLYLYDWSDADGDGRITSDETRMVSRAGSWGTVQELRIADPGSRFSGVPVVGVYPVPAEFSYWRGALDTNSTEIEYELVASYYKRARWSSVWLGDESITVPPGGTARVTATLFVAPGERTGAYQGFLEFSGRNHTVNLPVSYAVLYNVDAAEPLTVIPGSKRTDPLHGTGHIMGAFDMTGRYMNGDWRQFYFEIDDDAVNSAAIQVDWSSPDTSVALFVMDPMGSIVQTNVPSGVFGETLDWVSLDWLGITPFSEGGGFYPVKNRNDTSTVLHVPINMTGTYAILAHTTLFGGESITEPITVSARFGNITPDSRAPVITLDIPAAISRTGLIQPVITDETPYSTKYEINQNPVTREELDAGLADGAYSITVRARDLAGHESSESAEFVVDSAAPVITIHNPENNTIVTGNIHVWFDVEDATEVSYTVSLPDGTVRNENKTSFDYDARVLEDGIHEIAIDVSDAARNTASSIILFEKRSAQGTGQNTLSAPEDILQDSTTYYVILGAVLGAAAVGATVLLLRRDAKGKESDTRDYAGSADDTRVSGYT